MTLPLYKRASTEAQRAYAKAGIPARFWQVKPDDLLLRPCRQEAGSKTISASSAVQKTALRQCVSDPRGQLICIGSTPTDEGALMVASSVAMGLLHHNVHPRFLDTQYVRKRIPKPVSAVVFYNLLHHASDDRTEAVRDRLLSFAYTVRIVCVAGCADPYEFCTTRLGLYPEFCCYALDPDA